jgi:hypothetical protein
MTVPSPGNDFSRANISGDLDIPPVFMIKTDVDNLKKQKCPRPDLNRRQPDLQSGALPS